ncbi:D-alanine--D-alanine ligase family protein [Chamaesiphon minutus]|uniref:ATP-grasp enzyme, D-alanine-D-alanine ligase n=1 Tax=Chamaesiphon minutus (strain ATCC 27169 / PCC 6605) TaxID=1173020 RepID=K9UI36_CHAP6|nr:ATP-grasp enzyme, D-alanine-D-alanine ligase [Chamaesiphon minutus]AFY93859.1 ATP-grasp enzyme, D-alanine-D-alanine ligase [Chamaesiphon minutus PCC 6605]
MGLRVLHLVGSAVSEFYGDLSRLYAQDCLESTANVQLYEFHIAYITPDRQWRFPADLSREAIALASPMSVAEAVRVLTTLQIDVMVPQMFCIPGMTYYRALFDLLDIPYLGNTPDLMALTANKAKARSIVAAAGVSVPPGELLRIGNRAEPVRIKIDPPAAIKPVDADNSLGVTLVRNRAEYDSALKTAFNYADEVLVETFIELGREVRCGIIDRDGELVCLPLEEYGMDKEHQPIRRYEDKLGQNKNGDLYMVAKDITRSWIVDPDDPITARVWDAAKKCHIALGCRHYSLFDFRIDPSGQPWFLEAGLYCSFASKSVISMMATAADISLEKLFQISVNKALLDCHSDRLR